MTTFKRKRKLIEPRIQIRFAILFLSTAALATLVQTIVFAAFVHLMAERAPNDGQFLLNEASSALLWSASITFLTLAPLTLALGVLSTFPIVGPLYRFRVYLGQIVSGEAEGPCRIRKSDDLQDLCVVLNQAVEQLRTTDSSASETATDESKRAA